MSTIRSSSVICLLGVLSLVPLSGETVTVLLDFGDDVSFRGVSVVSPDVNGNYWNSVRPGFYFADLVDTQNRMTTLDYGPGAHPTDSYNGPAGDTTVNGPAMSDIDAAALGFLGINEAAYDYHVGVLGTDSGYFQIQGLKVGTLYTLRLYGAHKYIAEPNGLTRYNVYTDEARTELVGTVDLGVGSIGDAHNRDTLGVIENITPGPDGIFYMEFGGADGTSSGFINAMSVSYEASTVDLWAGYEVTPDGGVNSEDFLGWLDVSGGDYVWSYTLSSWLYLPESLVGDSGSWVYVFKQSASVPGVTDTQTWVGYDKAADGSVNAAGFLGWLDVSGGDFVWSYDLGRWLYLPVALIGESGAWVYVMK